MKKNFIILLFTLFYSSFTVSTIFCDETDKQSILSNSSESEQSTPLDDEGEAKELMEQLEQSIQEQNQIIIAPNENVIEFSFYEMLELFWEKPLSTKIVILKKLSNDQKERLLSSLSLAKTHISNHPRTYEIAGGAAIVLGSFLLYKLFTHKPKVE